MEEEKSIARAFLLEYETAGEADYPEEFLQKYEPLECLASNRMGETLLVRDHDNTPYIVKCYSNKHVPVRTSEGELLKNLHHGGLPAFVEEIRGGDVVCVVRQYVRGIPLDKLGGRLTQAQAVSVALQLCDVLHYLHMQSPPIIHRDVKPQNVVISEDGQATLIDFGISRVYDKNARSDTVCFGTQEFAPPEQYGFAQTDCRADIFSLGVLLGWMLTGKTSEFDVRDRRLKRIVEKCTAFAPKDRYSGAAALKRALQNADRHIQRRALHAVAAVLLALGLLGGGFALGRYMDVQPAALIAPARSAVGDPVLEAAVRYQLGVSDGEEIEHGALALVEDLYVYGDQFADSWDGMNRLRADVISGAVTPGIRSVGSLEDLKEMPNLTGFCLGSADVSDLSALAAVKGLRILELFDCPAEDFSAVAELRELEHLTLQDCRNMTRLPDLENCTLLRELVLTSNPNVTDYSVLSRLAPLEYLHLSAIDPELFLPHLNGGTVRQLKVGWWPIDSLADFAGIDGLEELIVEYMDFDSLEGGGKLDSLTRLTLLLDEPTDLSPLLKIPNLRVLTLSANLEGSVEAALAGAPFEIRYE
jgi:hypothetical protein